MILFTSICVLTILTANGFHIPKRVDPYFENNWPEDNTWREEQPGFGQNEEIPEVEADSEVIDRDNDEINEIFNGEDGGNNRIKDIPLGIPDDDKNVPGEPLTPQDFANAKKIGKFLSNYIIVLLCIMYVNAN